MPINTSQSQKELDDALAQSLAARKQSIPAESAVTQANVESGRNDAFDAYNKLTSGIVQTIGINPSVMAAAAPSFGRESQRLGRSLTQGLASRQLGEQRTNLGRIHAEALRKAVDAGYSAQDARAYADQVAADNSRREFEASQSEASRQTSLRKETIANEFRQKGLAQEQQFQPQSPYESAVTRSLFGLGGSIGTAYLLRGRKQQQPVDTSMNVRATVVPGDNTSTYEGDQPISEGGLT